MNETQKLQQLANQKFGENFLRIEFQRFTGFYAYPGTGCPEEARIEGCTFLGDKYRAKEKLEQRNLSYAVGGETAAQGAQYD